MSTPDLARRAWTEDDKRQLIEYWETLGSIILIALLLDRPEGSVQTEASRLNLPRRLEDKGHHRKKWTEDQLRALRTAVNAFRTPDGKIKIIEVANVTGRTVDAVASKLAADYGSREELRNALYIPADLAEVRRKAHRNAASVRAPVTDSRKLTKMRGCLSCTKPFWSEGAHNRICPRCKSDHDSDWGD
jgi:hypothetical protein